MPSLIVDETQLQSAPITAPTAAPAAALVYGPYADSIDTLIVSPIATPIAATPKRRVIDLLSDTEVTARRRISANAPDAGLSS